MTNDSSDKSCAFDSDGVLSVVRWSGWIKVGAVMAGLSVALGAVAAHGIDGYLADVYSGETRKVAGQSIPAAEKYLDDFKTASRYQMAHALGLILIGVLATLRPNRWLTAAGWCHVLGIVMFCGRKTGRASASVPWTISGAAPPFSHLRLGTSKRSPFCVPRSITSILRMRPGISVRSMVLS